MVCIYRPCQMSFGVIVTNPKVRNTTTEQVCVFVGNQNNKNTPGEALE